MAKSIIGGISTSTTSTTTSSTSTTTAYWDAEAWRQQQLQLKRIDRVWDLYMENLLSSAEFARVRDMVMGDHEMRNLADIIMDSKTKSNELSHV